MGLILFLMYRNLMALAANIANVMLEALKGLDKGYLHVTKKMDNADVSLEW